MKNILLFFPRVVASLFLSVAFVICFLIAWLMSFGGLIAFVFGHKNLRKNGISGIFHAIFFRLSRLYQVTHAFKLVWDIN